MELNKQHMIKWFTKTNEKIQQQKDYLTTLDQPIGDGDHGINMARGYQEIVTKLVANDYSDVSSILKDVSMTLLAKVGGASGPLYGTIFLRMSMALKGEETVSLQSFAEALAAALEGVKQRGKSDVGEKTLIDVWEPVCAYFQSEHVDSHGLIEVASNAKEQTKDRIATKGRAAYFKENSKGHIDPGAASSYIIFEALADVLKENA